MKRSILVLALLAAMQAEAQTPSPDLTAIDVPMSNAGKTLVTSDGVWNFGTQTTTDGGNQILLNGNGSNGGYGKIIQVGDGGKLFALANDNSWWVWDKVTHWSTSPGTPYVFNCAPVTLYTDGSTINKQVTYTFYRGTSPKDFQTQVNTEPTCTHTYYGLTGLNYITVTSKDPSNNESAISNQIALGLISKAPQAPANLVVKGNVQVFAVKQVKNHFATTNPVGTVPIGTLCDSTQRVNDMFAVDRDKVTWYGSVKPQAVVAQCDVP